MIKRVIQRTARSVVYTWLGSIHNQYVKMVLAIMNQTDVRVSASSSSSGEGKCQFSTGAKAVACWLARVF